MPQNTLRVINRAHEGYRRAGIALAKGDNALDASALSAAQLQALCADPRLVVQHGDSANAATAPAANVAQTSGRVGTADSAAGVKAKPAKKAPAKAAALTTELPTEQGA